MRYAKAVRALRAIRYSILATMLLGAIAGPRAAYAQGRPDPAALIAAQKEAMAKLATMDGIWRGTATIAHEGAQQEITQTERIGSFLDGTLKVIEGRGYDPEGKMVFNAFAVVSYDPGKKAYSMRSYAMGQAGDFAFTPTEEGFAWEIPAGPMTIRYVATIKDGVFHEVGERVMPGKEPVRFIEMNLKRVGDTDWPEGGAVGKE
jgi:hypothetical protein